MGEMNKFYEEIGKMYMEKKELEADKYFWLKAYQDREAKVKELEAELKEKEKLIEDQAAVIRAEREEKSELETKIKSLEWDLESEREAAEHNMETARLIEEQYGVDEVDARREEEKLLDEVMGGDPIAVMDGLNIRKGGE